MRLFSHTIAEYTCTKHCGYHRSVPGANMSRFHMIAAATAALPLWGYWMHEKLPWYYFPSLVAGELLLVYLAGFLAGLVTAPFRGAAPSRCPQCRAPVMFAGRHFDPKGSARPHWGDIAIFGVFIALNAGVWIAIAQGAFP